MSKSSNSSGFTLIELLVVVSIISILTIIGMVIFTSATKAARISRRLGDLQALGHALETYRSGTGAYPVYTTAPTTCAANGISISLVGLTPSYMPALPVDPSGGTTNCYYYESDANGTAYKVWTSNAEMTNADYNQQPGLVDPKRDQASGYGTDQCTVDSSPAPTAWAVYVSLGVSTSDACAF